MVMDEQKCHTMSNQFEYELINIEWSLNYDTIIENQDSLASEDIVVPESTDSEKRDHEFDENGIPMGTSTAEVKIREQLIFDFYQKWKTEHPEKAVFNKNLQSNIFIRISIRISI